MDNCLHTTCIGSKYHAGLILTVIVNDVFKNTALNSNVEIFSLQHGLSKYKAELSQAM